jgi:hypothetical protein
MLRRLTAHGLRTTRRPSRSFPRFVARAGPPESRYVSETFLRRDEAIRWSRVAELAVDRNEPPVSSRIARQTKFGDLVQLHIEDMTAVGKPLRRSEAATLDMLQRELARPGSTPLTATG